MSSRTNLRGYARVATTMLATATIAFGPAVSDAAAKTTKHTAKKPAAALKEAKNSKPVKVVAAPAPGATVTGLVNKLGLSASTQLAAMNTAVTAAIGFYPGRSTGCQLVTPMLASQPG